MKRSFIRLSVVLVGLVCIVVIPLARATNISGESPSGIAISPAIQQIALGDGQTSYSYKLLVSNLTSEAVTIKASSADFRALNQNGGVAFVGQTDSILSRKHGLAAWLQVPSAALTLKPNEQQQVVVRLAGLDNLPLGGHYGAVLLHIFPAEQDAATKSGSHVLLDQLVSSLVFLTTAHGGIASVQLLKPDLDGLQFSLPSSLNLFWKANGNTQVTPRGSVDIVTSHGDLLRHAVINPNSALVLPETTRLLSANFPSIGHQPLLPGHYQMLVQYRVDGDAHLQLYRVSFYYVNPRLLVGIVTALAILFAVLRLRNRQSANGKAPPALIVRPHKTVALNSPVTSPSPTPDPAVEPKPRAKFTNNSGLKTKSKPKPTTSKKPKQ